MELLLLLLLLLLLVAVVLVAGLPNRLGIGVEEDEVVEFVGLLAIKENAGFGAAEESVGENK